MVSAVKEDMNDLVGRWIYCQMDEQINGWILILDDFFLDGWMDGWSLADWMNGWIDGWIAWF